MTHSLINVKYENFSDFGGPLSRPIMQILLKLFMK